MSAITIVIFILFIFFVVILVEGWYIFLLHRQLRQIGIDSKGHGVLDHITELTNTTRVFDKKLDKLLSLVNESQKKSLLAYQHIGLVRFNPFNDLGGDHSFSVALLDGHFSGILITGLHTRDRTRVYMKEIKSGTTTQSLSKEEEKALQKALKSGN